MSLHPGIGVIRQQIKASDAFKAITPAKSTALSIIFPPSSLRQRSGGLVPGLRCTGPAPEPKGTHSAAGTAVGRCVILSTAPVSKELLTLLAVESNYWGQKATSCKSARYFRWTEDVQRRTLLLKMLILLPLCFINFWSSFISTSILLAVARFNRLRSSSSSIWETIPKWRLVAI